MKVMVFGTFDIIHPGHLDFFKQARKYGNQLTAVVARDRNVKKVKGKTPVNKEKKRLNEVNKVSAVDKAVLGDLKDPYRIIKKDQPDVICLGYDQDVFTKNLSKNFPKIKIIRLKAYKQQIYKSSKLKSILC